MIINDEDMNPETALRSDLWSTMTASELHNQQTLMITRLSAAGIMVSNSTASEGMRSAYMAIQLASDQLTQIINEASSKRKA